MYPSAVTPPFHLATFDATWGPLALFAHTSLSTLPCPRVSASPGCGCRCRRMGARVEGWSGSFIPQAFVHPSTHLMYASLPGPVPSVGGLQVPALGACSHANWVQYTRFFITRITFPCLSQPLAPPLPHHTYTCLCE
eukprot:354651-Chlamydomonas_euryale.AAC.1